MERSTENMLHDLDRRWESLTIANDFVFGKVMLDEGLCREVLEAILNVQIERVEYIGRQSSLKETPEGKGVRLDVYVRDGKGTVYNVEMQATDTRELPQRSRYYHSMLALSQLTEGKPYRELPDAYVIFICGFDLFGRNRRVYSFENVCLDDGSLRLSDGSHTIFLAASAPSEPGKGARVNELLDYVSAGIVSGELSSKLDDAVARVRNNSEWRLEFMWQEVRDQLNLDEGRRLGIQEGLERGREEGRQKGLSEGLAQGLAEGRKAGLAEGREQGLADGREAGLAEGREQGLADGREAGLAEGREQGLADGRKAGLAEGREQGLADGREAGLAEGEAKITKLITRLTADGRTEDVPRIATDASFRQQLYQKYGLG